MTNIINTAHSPRNQIICADMVKKNDYDRYLTTLFMTEEQRRSLNALYAFNIEIAKIVEVCSEPLTGEIRLQWWRDTLKAASQGDVQSHPVVEELSLLFPRHQLTAHDLMLIINARSRELHNSPMDDTSRLVEHCRLTAGTLNRLTLAIMSENLGHSHIARAENVGTAWGVIGIIRNIPFHASMQQCLLPQDLIQKLNIEEKDMYRGIFSPALKDIIEALAGIAQKQLFEGTLTPPKEHRNAFLFGSLCRVYLKQLKTASYDIEKADFHKGNAGKILRLTWSAMTGRL